VHGAMFKTFTFAASAGPRGLERGRGSGFRPYL